MWPRRSQLFDERRLDLYLLTRSRNGSCAARFAVQERGHGMKVETKTQCLTQEELVAYGENELTDNDEERVREHISACDSCLGRFLNGVQRVQRTGRRKEPMTSASASKLATDSELWLNFVVEPTSRQTRQPDVGAHMFGPDGLLDPVG